MDIRYAVHPEHAEAMDTESLRVHFLVDQLFITDRIKFVYSFNDRLNIGGAMPHS